MRDNKIQVRRGAAALLVLVLVYLAFWPVPIAPKPWQPPDNPGYVGPHAVNDRLKGIEVLPIAGDQGPEAVAVDSEGRVYVSTHEGNIVRLAPGGLEPKHWAKTGGRPLGMDFDGDGNLIVADAYRGLLSISPSAEVTTLATEADGVPIRYANDVAVAADGRVYFSDASTKFGAESWGGTYPASLLDIMEHGAHGRLLVYDPTTKATRTVVDGLSFANGVAMGPNQDYVLVNETARYRVTRVWISGPRSGQTEIFADALPAFPDNIVRGQGGRYWVGLVSPRNPLLDALAGWPRVRKVVQRLPSFLRPEAERYGHLIALDESGRVQMDLQDPSGSYPMTTGAAETDEFLYVSSLMAPGLGRLRKAGLGLEP
jgi:sugar lactone lactonase YvrE